MTGTLFVGVDVGGTHVRATTLTADGTIGPVARATLDTEAGAAGVLGQLVSLVADTVGAAEGHLDGIGLAVSGPVDVDTGIVSNPWTLPSLAGTDIRTPLLDRFQVPVIVENDADAAGLGEYFHGAGRGADSLAMVTLGTGLGVALIRDGVVLRGTGGYHPEAGHHAISDTGPTCYCGLVGCWEDLASGTALERAARTAVRDGRWSPAAAITTAADVTAAADAGDRVARELLDELAFHVGRGLRTVEAFYAPETIAIGGGLGSRLDLLAAGIERGRTPPSTLSPRARVVGAALGDSAGAVGAASSIRARRQEAATG